MICFRGFSKPLRQYEDVTPIVRSEIERGIAAGEHTGAQVYVSYRGETVADFALGEARPSVAMSTNSITLWMSSGKPIAAIAIAILMERGLVALDQIVASIVPEFGQGGKEAITLRHLLTHTGGFRAVSSNRSNEPWDQIIAKICAAKIEPGWVPGKKAGYHVASSWFMLGEIVRRIDGRTYDALVREEIFLPPGMDDCYFAIARSVRAQIGNRIAMLYDTSKPGIFTPVLSDDDDLPLCRPGATARGPIAQLGRFYESMLSLVAVPPLEPPTGGIAIPPYEDGRAREGEAPAEPGAHRRIGPDSAGASPSQSHRAASAPARIISPETARLFTSRHRAGLFDESFKHIVDWGLGFIVNSARYGKSTIPYGFGDHASDATFGHSGNQSSCAFADPVNQLVVAWTCNGMPGEAKHDARLRAINNGIYKDLGLNDQ